MTRGAVRVGTSGWSYKDWRGIVYPEGLPSRNWFVHYAQLFDTVELNNTFYQLPNESSFDTWRTSTPQNFLFAVKGSRFITHMESSSFT